MGILSAEAVGILADVNGIPRSQLATCIAIAWAESGLNTDAVGQNPATPHCPGGSRDRGLWQINSCYHPDVTDQCAFDPQCNCEAMVRISSTGTNWQPWSTYDSGAYLRYLAAAQVAVSKIATGTVTYDAAHQLRVNIENGMNVWSAGVAVINALVRTMIKAKFGSAWDGWDMTGGQR